jgi:hypothetical protein
MNINGTHVNLATLKSWLRQLASIAGLFVSIANTDHLPVAVRSILLAGSLWIQKTQHVVDLFNDPTTPNPAPVTTITIPTNPPPPSVSP